MSKHPNTDLLSLEPEGLVRALESHFRQRDQPVYRIGQVRRWLYEGLSASIDEMTDLPLSERDALKHFFTLTQLEKARVEVSQDGTVKHLWRLSDGEFVESDPHQKATYPLYLFASRMRDGVHILCDRLGWFPTAAYGWRDRVPVRCFEALG